MSSPLHTELTTAQFPHLISLSAFQNITAMPNNGYYITFGS